MTTSGHGKFEEGQLIIYSASGEAARHDGTLDGA